MDEPVLRAKQDTGDVYEDPSEDLLYMLLEDIESGDAAWMIVERLSDRSGQTFFQAAAEGEGFTVERRAGGPDTHVAATVADLDAAHALATAWAFELPGLDAVTWVPVTPD